MITGGVIKAIMKKITVITLSALIILMAGCKSTQENTIESTTSSAADTSVSALAVTAGSANIIQTQKEPETEEEYYEAMVERSLTSIGNTSRINAKIEQAKSGKKTVIAYIGGSITEGYAGGPDGCYAKLSYNYFAETYGTGDNVEYVNAGVSGTASTVGNLRVTRDVLSYEPDIVFIEFAVNDGQDRFMKDSYESLVKTLLTQENEPAVVLLFNRTVDGHSAQKHMKMIGTHYSLPMISVVDAITPELNSGRMKWEDYSVDAAHPSADGHKLISKFIEHMYRTAESTPSEPYELPEKAIFSTKYTNAVMTTFAVSNDEITITDKGCFAEIPNAGHSFEGYWEYNPKNTESSEPMKLTARGNAFFLIFRSNNTDNMASVDVYVNGELVNTINSKEEYGWGGPAAAVVVEYDNVQDMTVEIRPSADETGKKTFTIFGLAISQN